MRHPLYLRLRPFVRRELTPRLLSAAVTLAVLTGLVWLGISALTSVDSREAQALRVQIGLEQPGEVCGRFVGAPACSYDDRVQAQVDETAAREARLRRAVLDELEQRAQGSLGAIDRARGLLGQADASPDAATQLRAALRDVAVDLRPTPVTSVHGRRATLLHSAELDDPISSASSNNQPAQRRFDGLGWVSEREQITNQREILAGLQVEQDLITGVLAQVSELRARETATLPPVRAATEDPTELRDALLEAPGDASHELAQWVDAGYNSTSPATGVSADLVDLAQTHTAELMAAAIDPADPVWHGGWTANNREPITKPSERYRSPISDATHWRLFGASLLLLGALFVTGISPVVTATATAREREAGTLPVLRMTGLSAGDLALAMIIGPNVFALVTGGGLLAGAALILGLTAGWVPATLALAAILVLGAATHLSAIGLGDALGQRVNATVVGGLLGLALAVPGLVGSLMAIPGSTATGFLLGPMPVLTAGVVHTAGLGHVHIFDPLDQSAVGVAILAFSIGAQLLLGGICLLSWRRRVEHSSAPLFRPLEGALLGLVSVGCAALALLDLSEHIHVQTYDQVNFVTLVATGFLLPILGWLLVSSLVRPTRGAVGVTSSAEARRGFLRFQGFLGLTAAAFAGAYHLVLSRSGLDHESSQIMWATLGQGLLAAETVAATLLLASRKAHERHRVLILGAVVVALQLVLMAGVYALEVDHVAATHTPGSPWLIGMEASPYWVAFLVVLWAAGLGLCLAALLRERDRAADDLSDREDPEGEDADGDDNDEKQRWLH